MITFIILLKLNLPFSKKKKKKKKKKNKKKIYQLQKKKKKKKTKYSTLVKQLLNIIIAPKIICYRFNHFSSSKYNI